MGLVSLHEEEILTETCIEGDGVDTQGEGDHLQVKERGIRRNNSVNTLNSGFRPLEQ